MSRFETDAVAEVRICGSSRLDFLFLVLSPSVFLSAVERAEGRQEELLLYALVHIIIESMLRCCLADLPENTTILQYEGQRTTFYL